MKNFLKLFLLILIIVISGCNNSDDDKNTNDKNEYNSVDNKVDNFVEDKNPPASIKLNYSFIEGESFKYSIESKNTTSQTIKSDTIISQNGSDEIKYQLEFNIEDVDENMTADIEVTINSIEINANAGGQAISYKSGTLTDSTEIKKYVDYESIVKSPFNIRVNKNGELIEITKVDRITNKFLKLQNALNQVNQEQKKQISFNISEGALKPLIKQVFREFPQNELGLDSTWEESTPSKFAIFDANNIAKYEIDNFEKSGDERIAVIKFNAIIETKGKNEFTEQGVKYNFKKPDAKGVGTIKFNISKGLIQHALVKSTVNTSMKMELPPNAPGPKNAERTDKITSEHKIKLL